MIWETEPTPDLDPGMLADRHVLTPGQRRRFDRHRTLTVATYTLNATTPDLNLNDDRLLLIDM